MLYIQRNQRLNCVSLFILLLSAVILLGLAQASSPETRISNSIHHHHASTKRSSRKRNRAVPGVTNKRLLQSKKKSKKEDLPLQPLEELPDETPLPPPPTEEDEEIEGIPPPELNFNNDEEDEEDETPPPPEIEENEGVGIPPDVEEGPLEQEEKHDLHPPADAPSNHNGTKTIASYSVAEYSARNNSSSSSALYYLFGIAIVVAGTMGIIQIYWEDYATSPRNCGTATCSSMNTTFRSSSFVSSTDSLEICIPIDDKLKTFIDKACDDSYNISSVDETTPQEYNIPWVMDSDVSGSESSSSQSYELV